VWNALAEMGITNDVKKGWIKLYAQNLPGKGIPEESESVPSQSVHYVVRDGRFFL